VPGPAAAPDQPPPPRGPPPSSDIPEAPAPPKIFFAGPVEALCLDDVVQAAPPAPAPTSARLWPLDGTEVLQAASPIEFIVKTPERSEASPLRRKRRRELKDTQRQQILADKLDAMRAQVDLLKRRSESGRGDAAARTLQRTWRRGRRPPLNVVPPRRDRVVVHEPARSAAVALIQRSWRRLPRREAAPRRGRPRRRLGVREALRAAAEEGRKRRRDSEERQRRQKRELEANGGVVTASSGSPPRRSRDASPGSVRPSPGPGLRRESPRDAISRAAARGAARRAQAEAKAAKLKAELEEQYGIARARIEAAAADADTSPSPPPARRKPRRASARFRNLSLDDVPEEPAAVSTAGAAGRAVAAARAQRDDVDVLALSGSLASMLHAAEESDDESVAPPDEPPPNVPEDAVALAE